MRPRRAGNIFQLHATLDRMRGTCTKEQHASRPACKRTSTHLEILLRLPLVDLYGEPIRPQRRGNDGVLVHILQQHGGADGGPVVHAAAAVAMSARPVNKCAELAGRGRKHHPRRKAGMAGRLL
jgi:hypothetical protein